MPKAAARLFQFYTARYAPEVDIKLHPIALTSKQVEEDYLIKDEYGDMVQMPSAPDKIQIELDALEAFYPGAMAEILEDHLKLFFDSGLYREFTKSRLSAEESLGEAWEEATEDQRERAEELEQEIKNTTKSYEKKLVKLKEELQEELSPYKEKLEELTEEIKEEHDNLEVDWPDLPVSEVDDSAIDWFFDCQRDYLTQMGYYNQYKEGSISEKQKELDREREELNEEANA